jgi:hypothetical protein
MKKPEIMCDKCWESSNNQYHCGYMYCHGNSYGCSDDCSCKKNGHKPHPCTHLKGNIYCECKRCPNCGKIIN